MIKVVKERPVDNKELFVGTHNGIFHCDEVLAVAILSIIAKKNGNTNVIRSRDLKFLDENTDLLVDVGGGEFDHHQKGGNGQRENGVKYASAGLIWRKFGNQLISNLSDNKLSQEEVILLSELIDEKIIQSVDMEDNGQLTASHPFKFIVSFLPKWNKESNYDEKFEECINVVSTTLENIIESYISLFLARKQIHSDLIDSEKRIGNVLEVPCQTIPWMDILIEYNEKAESKIDFVIFPYPAGGWALQCVPPSKEDNFSQRIQLPQEWAGETTGLPAISGVQSATFCHNGRFFARALDKADVIRMCNLATKRYQETQNIGTTKNSL